MESWNASAPQKEATGKLLNAIRMERLVQYTLMCRGRKTATPEYPGSRSPAQNEMRMKDVLFLNFFGKKGHKTAAPPASPRGILHLTLLGARISMHKTNLVARLCEGGTACPDEISGTEANLLSLADRT
jgi:hypothetical protein